MSYNKNYENLKLPKCLKARVKSIAKSKCDISMIELITIWCDKEEDRSESNRQ